MTTRDEAPALARSGRRFDPRWWQICCLSGLLTYGVFWLSFDVPPIQIAATIGTALAVQWVLTRALKVPTFEWKSALISGLGLCFLFRASEWWLAAPMTIPLHRLQNGALMIFTFHMISDPKTTPNTRAGRILFACLVAAGAAFVAFVLFRPNGPIWALAALAPIVPLIDRFLPGPRYDWKRPVTGPLWKGDSREPMAARARDLPGGRLVGAGRV